MVHTLQHTRHTTRDCDRADVVTDAVTMTTTAGSSSHRHTRPRSVSQSLHKAHTMCASDAATAPMQPHYQSLRVARCRHIAAASVCECDTTRRRRQRWGHVTPRCDTHHATATRDTAPPHTTTRYSMQSHPAAHREQGQCTPHRHSGCTRHTPCISLATAVRRHHSDGDATRYTAACVTTSHAVNSGRCEHVVLR
jgi:hypothetical protein